MQLLNPLQLTAATWLSDLANCLALLPPSRLLADAQQRFVSKQRAFGASSAGSESGAADVHAADFLAASGGSVPAWQQRLCGSDLAGGLPPYRMLKGSCPLTSRKVGCMHWLACRLAACLACMECSLASVDAAAGRLLLVLCANVLRSCARHSSPWRPLPRPLPQFPKLTARAVGRLFSDCHSGLHLLGPAACEPAAAPAAAPQQDGWQQEGAEQEAAEQPGDDAAQQRP